MRSVRAILERIDARLGRANNELKFVAKAIRDIQGVQEELQAGVMAFRNAETLAQPANWRLMAEYDEIFVCEFLNLVDENILFLALQCCDKRVLDIFKRVSGGE